MTRVQFLDNADCILSSANRPGNGLNPIILILVNRREELGF